MYVYICTYAWGCVFGCGCVSKQGCNALIWCLATGRQTCNIFYLPCHRRVAPLQCSLCAHNFCLRCTISRAPHDPPLCSGLFPVCFASQKGSKFKCNEQKSMQPQSSSCQFVRLPCSPSAKLGRVYYKIHLHRAPYVWGWEEVGLCDCVCVWVGVNRRRAVLLDCCK